MITIGQRIRRALGLSWKQVNDTRSDPDSPWDIVTWRCSGDPKDAGNWTVLTVQPKL